MPSKKALQGEIGAAVRELQRAVDTFDDAAGASLGVNRTDLRCLDALLELGSATAGRLGAALGLTTGSVTAMLDRLEKAGYLTRSAHPGDRRKVIIQPTPAAAERAYALYGPIADEGARVIAGYSTAELELLLDFLRRSRELYERHIARIQPAT